MATVVFQSGALRISSWVHDVSSFERWADDPDFPEKQSVWWLDGEVWADRSMEEYFTHLGVKIAFYSTLFHLAIESRLGRMVPDGLLYTNAEISGNPDGTFISRASRAAGTVTVVGGERRGSLIVRGTPDMVLGVMSDSSVRKDTDVLFDAYWRAGIPEYWLVDARQSPASFDIWRYTPAGYVAARREGWLKSRVFGKSFRLEELTDDSNDPLYVLEVR